MALSTIKEPIGSLWRQVEAHEKVCIHGLPTAMKEALSKGCISILCGTDDCRDVRWYAAYVNMNYVLMEGQGTITYCKILRINFTGVTNPHGVQFAIDAIVDKCGMDDGIIRYAYPNFHDEEQIAHLKNYGFKKSKVTSWNLLHSFHDRYLTPNQSYIEMMFDPVFQEVSQYAGSH